MMSGKEKEKCGRRIALFLVFYSCRSSLGLQCEASYHGCDGANCFAGIIWDEKNL